MFEDWTWLWIPGVAVALLVVLVLTFRSKYSKVLSDAHLNEVCEALDRIRHAACEHVGRPLPTTPEEAARDPRTVETSAGMRLAYSVAPSEGDHTRFAHYLSMSHADRLPAESFARFMLGLAIVRCGRRPGEVAAMRSPNLVTHLAFELPLSEQTAYAAASRESQAPGPSVIHSLRREWAAAGRAVKVERAP